MNPIRLYLIAALSPALALSAFCQTPPPALPAGNVSAPQAPLSAPQSRDGVATSHSGRVSSVIYGPQGEVQGLTLRNGIAVALPPELAMRLQSSVTRGARVQVSGVQRMIAGQASLVAQSITANGQTFVSEMPLHDRRSGRAATGPATDAGAPPPPSPVGPPDPRNIANRGQGVPPPPTGAVPPPPPRNTGNPLPPPPVQDSGVPSPPPSTTGAGTLTPQPPGATVQPASLSDIAPTPQQR